MQSTGKSILLQHYIQIMIFSVCARMCVHVRTSQNDLMFNIKDDPIVFLTSVWRDY